MALKVAMVLMHSRNSSLMRESIQYNWKPLSRVSESKSQKVGMRGGEGGSERWE